MLEAREFWGKELRDVHHVDAPRALPVLRALRCENGRYLVTQNDREFELRPGALAIVKEDSLTFALRLVQPARLEKAPRAIDFGFLNVLVITFFAMLTWVGAMHLYPEEIETLDEVSLMKRPEFVQAVLQQPPTAPPTLAKTESDTLAAGAKPRKSAGKQAKSGGAFDPRKIGIFGAINGPGFTSLLRDDSAVSEAMSDLKVGRTAALGELNARDGGFDGPGDSKTLGMPVRGGPGGTPRPAQDVTLGKRVERDVIVEAQAPITKGALPPELIAQVMKENRNGFRYCYERALQSHHDLTGSAKVQFVIGPDGKVISATVKEETIGTGVPDCLLMKVRGLQFPRPQGGGVVVVTYPFVFRST